MDATVTLYRPTGPKELQLVAESGYRAWPPRLTGQPIFYPVLNEEYATQIARGWNAKDRSTGYCGFVTRFKVQQEFLARYDVHRVGGHVHDEYWIPAEDLDEFNRNIVGPIEVIAEYAGGPDHEPRQVRSRGLGENRASVMQSIGAPTTPTALTITLPTGALMPPVQGNNKKGVMRRLRRWLIVLASIVATVVGICIILVAIPLVIGAHNADDNIAAMGRLINTAVAPGTMAARVREFLHGHDTLTLPHGHFEGGGGATPFVHLPRYEPNDGEDQIYPGGEALFASWFGPGGEELDVVFFFDGRGHLLRHSVNETWLHMP